MRKLQYKFYLGYGVLTSLIIIMGSIALWTNKQIVMALEDKQENYRVMLDAAYAAHDINRYAKSAEIHLILYLDFNEENSRVEYSKDIESLQNQIFTLLAGKYDPEGQGILNAINSEREKLLSNGKLLLFLKDQGEISQDSFFVHNREIILAFHDATSNLRKLGVEFVHYATNFLNKQKAITAATEVSSYASRAAGHLMLFLNLHDMVDREKFFLRITSLEDQIEILDKSFVIQEGRSIIKDLRIKKDGLLANGIHILSLYDQDMETRGSFLPAQHSDDILAIYYIAKSLQDLGAEAEKHIINSEIIGGQSIIQYSHYFQIIIWVSFVCSLVISLMIGYWISIKLPKLFQKDKTDKLPDL